MKKEGEQRRRIVEEGERRWGLRHPCMCNRAWEIGQNSFSRRTALPSLLTGPCLTLRSPLMSARLCLYRAAPVRRVHLPNHRARAHSHQPIEAAMHWPRSESELACALTEPTLDCTCSSSCCVRPRPLSAPCSRTPAPRVAASVNVSLGKKEERLMMTGMHTVADIFCVGCGAILGWKYEAAHEKSQKYKEGKFILERVKVTGPDGTSYWVSPEAQVGGSDADDA